MKSTSPSASSPAPGHWGGENFVVAENLSGDSGVTKHGIDALPEKIAIAQFEVRVNGGYAAK